MASRSDLTERGQRLNSLYGPREHSPRCIGCGQDSRRVSFSSAWFSVDLTTDDERAKKRARIATTCGSLYCRAVAARKAQP